MFELDFKSPIVRKTGISIFLLSQKHGGIKGFHISNESVFMLILNPKELFKNNMN